MSKLVSLSEEAYKILARKKRGKESFSDVILREMGKKTKPNILQFAGILKNKAEWERIEKQLYKERRIARTSN